MLFRWCALIALVALAQIVRAQEEAEEVGAAESIKKQVDDGDLLDSRYGNQGKSSNSWSGNNRRGYNSGSSRRYQGGSGLGVGGSSLDGGLLGGGGANHAIRENSANDLVTNKVIAGTVSRRRDVVTRSQRVRVVASRKNNVYRQNSNSNILQKNVIKQTKIHVNKDVTVHKPLTVIYFKKHHHTQFTVKKQPVLTKISVQQKQDIYQPAVKNVIIRTNSESVRRQVLPTIVRQKSRYQRLPTIREPTRNAGTLNRGAALTAGSANLGNSYLGNNLGGFGGNLKGALYSNQYNNNNNHNNKYGRNYNNKYGGGKTHGRAGEGVEEEAPAVDVPVAEQEPEQETKA